MSDHNDRPIRATGRCNCGGVTYTIRGPVREGCACHCAECRRMTGGIWHATSAWREDLTIDDPHGRLRWYQSSPQARRGFCGECGASLFMDFPDRPIMVVTLGTMDAPTGVQLAMHIFTAEKGDYYEITDGLQQKADGPSGLPMPPRAD